MILEVLSMLTVGVALSLTAGTEQPAVDYPITPVPFTDVRIADEFWSKRQETNRAVTIPHVLRQCEETGRIDNFAVAGKLKEGKFRGYFFNDSDVYKLIEGIAYSLALHPDPKLEAQADAVIAKMAAAQEPDGYLYCSRTTCTPDNMPPGGKERWSDMKSGHELYCVGHMYEAAVAYANATGKRTLLDVAVKNADLVCKEFGPGKRIAPCGHPEVEIGLVKLHRATNDAKYLDLAKFFIEARGRGERPRYGEYAQDYLPVREQTAAVGHAVRAAYLYSGVADVAALTGDDDYIRVLDRLWDNAVGRKLYLTGGIGARGAGEAFGADYELPNSTAYAETCAAIANALWNQRMFLLHGDAKYADVLERIIYNGMLSGISLEGDRFFYVNSLESYSGDTRVPWFDCACCPPNVVRFIASIGGFAYAQRGDELYVNLFIGGTASIKMRDQTVRITQETRYPWDGRVRLTVEPAKTPAKLDLLVRIPGWARNEPVPSDLYVFADKSDAKPTLKVNGKPQDFAIEKGYARLAREWKSGDVVELDLPMPVRRVAARREVKDDVGKVALERGPLVYCVEAADHDGARVLSFVLPDDRELRTAPRAELLGGVTTITGKVQMTKRNVAQPPSAVGTEDGKTVISGEQDFTAIPYYAWAHRERGGMAVWLARDPAAARPAPADTIAFTSRASASFGGELGELSDQLEPSSSNDQASRRFHWWPHKGTAEWVQYDFPRPTKVRAVEVYWFDDTGSGECRLPKSWKLLAKVGGQWSEVDKPSGYGVEPDKYNRTTFEPVVADGLRLEIQSREGFAGGIYEWRVEGEGQATATVEEYGKMPDGRKVDLYTLTNVNGLRVRLTNYGATTVSVETPDRDGKLADVTLGYDTLDGWLTNTSYFGATVGRYANRIAKGKFTLDGKTYTLAANNGENHLHGGVKGFDKVLWSGEPVKAADAVGVKFTYLSKDGEEGYPGNLKVTAVYWLTNGNEYRAEFSATTDRPTIVNLVHHSYWNLTGGAAADILGHELMLEADKYTPVDDGLIPTGELRPVAGTPMDFTKPTAIGARIAQVPGGYDHNFILGGPSGKLHLAARVYEPKSGRVMEIYTDQPGVQFYSGNFLDGSVKGKGGAAYQKHWGFCLETQHYPDSPNRPQFPPVVLRPGETYRQVMVHKFSTR